jgi:hypothetical protein
MLLDSERTLSLTKNKAPCFPCEYKIKRSELISLIQRKTSMYKYKLKTFYLALYILDNIFLYYSNENLDCEAVALACLLLAGKPN